jgi:hypothetical protein
MLGVCRVDNSYRFVIGEYHAEESSIAVPGRIVDVPVGHPLLGDLLHWENMLQERHLFK